MNSIKNNLYSNQACLNLNSEAQINNSNTFSLNCSLSSLSEERLDQHSDKKSCFGNFFHSIYQFFNSFIQSLFSFCKSEKPKDDKKDSTEKLPEQNPPEQASPKPITKEASFQLAKEILESTKKQLEEFILLNPHDQMIKKGEKWLYLNLIIRMNDNEMSLPMKKNADDSRISICLSRIYKFIDQKSKQSGDDPLKSFELCIQYHYKNCPDNQKAALFKYEFIDGQFHLSGPSWC